MPTPRNRPLSRHYPALAGVPVLASVDLAIFSARYFGACMHCDFCHDACCEYGVDVSADEHARILERAPELERFLGIPRERWFDGEWEEDAEAPGGKVTRTSVEDGACVFGNRSGRGCQLHRFALEAKLDHHLVKPMISSLFPLTFGDGLLCVADEVEERTLVCLDQGPTIYRGARSELAYYFGPELVAELDALEALAVTVTGTALPQVAP